MSLQSLGTSVDRLLESLVHPLLRNEADILYRTRVLIGLLLTINALLIAVCISIVAGMSGDAKSLGLSLCMGLVAGNFVLLYVMRFYGRYRLCSLLAIALSTLVIVTGIVVSGGIRQSPAAQLLVVPPLMCFFFSGIRLGVWSVVVMIALVLLFFALEQAGVQFPFDASDADIDQSRTHATFLCIASVSALALIFERTSLKLKRERDIEHQRALVLAETDVLTGLANRRSFDAQLNARIDKQPPCDFTLCYVDLDGFKPINDRHGHSVGDQVLRTIAARLKHLVREHDVVGRHGGDEFTVIFNAPADTGAMRQMMDRMLAAIHEPIETSAGMVSVGASVGLACYPQHGNSIEEIKKAADQAMYAAKQERSQWLLYSGTMQPLASEENSR